MRASQCWPRRWPASEEFDANLSDCVRKAGHDIAATVFPFVTCVAGSSPSRHRLQPGSRVSVGYVSGAVGVGPARRPLPLGLIHDLRQIRRRYARQSAERKVFALQVHERDLLTAFKYLLLKHDARSTFIFAAFLARLRPTSRLQSSRRALRAAKQVLEFRSASCSRLAFVL